MNSNKKAAKERITIAVLIGALMLSIIGGGTLAQISKRAETENIISSGEISVKLFNKNSAGEDMPELITSIVPGNTLDNIVTVQNTCDYDEYIRVSIDTQIYDSDEEKTQLDSSKVHYLTNEDDWTYKDGYFYYNSPLKAGKLSKELYNGIYLDTSIGNAYKTAVLDVNITVEAVQYVNNGVSVFAAQGWEVIYK